MSKRIIKRRNRSKKRDITCKKATDLITDYLDGELEPEINSAFEEHLGECPDCVAFLRTYKKTVQIFKSIYQDISSKKMNKRVEKTIKERIKSKG